jgi:hypothetical protein
VGRRPFGPIREDVRAVCDAMMERLVEAEGRAGTPAAVQRGA